MDQKQSIWTKTLLEQNIDDPGLVNGFLGLTPKAQQQKKNQGWQNGSSHKVPV
jgi:hypothetical protein